MPAEAPIVIGPGTVVAGTYEVTEVLGRGGMGAVWAAQHLRLPGKRVAIKVLLGTGAGQQALARFRREAEIASRIGHPNIVEVLDFNTLADGTPYQVLEFLDGESLGQRMRRGAIPLAETVELVLQIGSALRAAHRAGVVHRDLKPDNIFLCPSDAGGVVHDRVKILDFGISKIRGSQTLQTQESVLIGTPQYMSPEQASAKNREVDQRTDVFALGAIVYEMLAGRPAFSGDSVVAVILDVVQGIPPPLASLVPSLPPEVDRAVARALAKRPEERFTEVADFVTALTGRTLQTLGDDARGTGRRGAVAPGSSPGGSRPPSAEEILGETVVAPGPLPVGLHGTLAMPLSPTPSPPTQAGPHDPVADPAARPVGPGAAPNATKKSRALGLALLSLLVGGGAIALGTWLPRIRGCESRGDVASGRPPAPARPPGAAVPMPAAVTGAANAGLPAAAPSAPPSGPTATPTPTDSVPARAGQPKKAARGPAAEVPAEVAAQLAEAERLLAAGDAGEAIRRARQSFFTLKTDRGWALLARAFCAQGDLENAKASLRNVRAGSSDRARASRDCAARGIAVR